MSIIATVLLGIAGAFLAGFAGRALYPATRDQPMHPAGFLYSLIGAIVLIFLGCILGIIG